MEFLFWLCAFLLFYIYFGYPLTLFVLRRFFAAETATGTDHEPTVSIVIAAHNEEGVIAETISNKLKADYPAAKLEIIVVSDGSVDGTDAIVESFGDQGVILIRQEPRQGKSCALNLGFQAATGEIVVLSDANSLYADDTVRRLVSRFQDPSVGYVTGKMVYVNEDGSMVGDGCSAYMKYENWLRTQESALGSIVGVDGGVDSVRRGLFRPLAADQLPDFVLPLSVVEQGFRVVYEESALLREHALDNADREFRMRTRVSLRALWALKDKKHMLNPFSFGLFGFQLIVHKLLRYLAFIPLVLLFLVNLFLLDEVFFILALAGQLGFYFLAWQGWRRQGMGRQSALYSVPFYYCLINVAAAHAAWRFLKGEKQVLWTPRAG
jgi:cellulose synthase/poly-beta-1,6-N-acetylglucosamine synthase-like glycosyltransferase